MVKGYFKKVKRENNLKFIFLFIALYTILFFIYKDKLLFTPDFGQSDAYHLNLSLKHFLAENLKQGRLPFWTDKLQGGFPLLAEGQIGALYLPNIIFLTIFPFHIGYNLLFIFALFMLSFGMYLLLKELKIPSLLSFLISLNFTLNGSIMLRLVHLNLIQTFSTVPLLFFLYLRFLKTRNKWLIVLFCFIISQMVFAGYTPIVFVSLFGLVWWFGARDGNIAHILFLCGLIFIGFLLAFPQIMSSYELSQFSSRAIQLSYETAVIFPLQLKNLVSFFVPYAHGNPKMGTYPLFSQDWGIFWENTPYIGKVFLLLFITSCVLFFFIKDKKYNGTNFLFLILFVLFALGKNSPLYFLFNFPLFNFFRVPSRYLMMAVFFMFLFIALLFTHLWGKNSKILKSVLVMILLVNIFDLFVFSKNYHLFIHKNKVLEKPTFANIINQNSMYLTFDQPENWNNVFLKKGWQGQKEVNAYLFFKNYLYTNSNLLFHKRSFEINSGGMMLHRQNYLVHLIKGNMLLQDKAVLMEMLGIRYIITALPIVGESFEEVGRIKNNDIMLSVFSLKKSSMSWYYLPERVTPITYVQDFEDGYQQINSLEKEAFVEGKYAPDIKKTNSVIKNEIRQDGYTVFNGSFNDDTFLVLKKNWYPAWRVYIDKKKVPTVKTNLVHIGFTVPKGKHQIELKYEDHFFRNGAYIASIVGVLFLFILFKLNLKFLNRLES